MTVVSEHIELRKVPGKILVIKPSSLGDVVHSLPFLNSLRFCFPSAEIHWVIAAGLEGVLEGHPMIDKLVVIHKDKWKIISKAGHTLREIRKLSRELKDERYDLTVDLQGLLRSGLICAASAAPVRVGFKEAREGSRMFYSHRIEGGREVHAVERYLKIAAALGCESRVIEFPFAPAADVRGFLNDIDGPYAVIVPGARWKTKIWPAENFGKVASFLPMKSVLIGGKKEISIADDVVAFSKGKAVSVAGKTSLQALIAIIRGACLVISNDSGPMHIAAAFGIPVVAIFGPTSPVRTGPYGEGHIIIKSDEKCSPCFRKQCDDLKCMKGITPDIVYKQMYKIIRDPEIR